MPGYQVAIVGPGASQHGPALRQRLRSRLKDLGGELPALLSLLSAKRTDTFDSKAPLVGVYFGGPDPSDHDLAVVGKLVALSAVVVPVLEDLNNVQTHLPDALQPINCIVHNAAKRRLDAIANIVLQNLGLLRQSRRLFISYRRNDSATAALQLRHALEAQGYDVFLDTHSVAKADPFQEVLWHRMADSDVVILLDTPTFLESRWTKEELANAEAMTIGIVQVVWPMHLPAPYSDLCKRLYLGSADFSSDRLQTETTERICLAVEQLRARSLAARHNNLMREFCDAATMAGAIAIVQPQRYATARLRSGRQIAAIPAVGVPDAIRYHEAMRRFPAGEMPASEVFLLYDHRGLRPSWSEFLNWLDRFLPVKAVRIISVAEVLEC
ncbi:hypothetical protein ACVME8_008801 [Bradyrhizobium diazoefficiens]